MKRYAKPELPALFSVLMENLHTIDKPTLIIWAEEDAYLPPRLGERIHQHIAGSSFTTLPACGHFLQEDEPETVTKLIIEFLQR